MQHRQRHDMRLCSARHLYPRPGGMDSHPTSVDNHALRGSTRPNLTKPNNLRKYERPLHRPDLPQLPSLRIRRRSRHTHPRRRLSNRLRPRSRPSRRPRTSPPTPETRLHPTMVFPIRHRRLLRDRVGRTPRRTAHDAAKKPVQSWFRGQLSRLLVRSGAVLWKTGVWAGDVGG